MAKLSSTQIYGDLQVDGEIKNKATTETEGVVQLNDNVNSTSTTQGATANAVKKVNDTLATHSTNTTSHITASERTTWNGKLDKSGGEVTGDLKIKKSLANVTISSTDGTGSSLLFDRGTGANYKLLDESGVFNIQTDWDGQKTNTYYTIMTLNHTSGNAWHKGTVTAPTFSGALSGNASTATKLQTARTINGVSFDGSANITVADSTKLPLSGGTVTGNVTFNNDRGVYTKTADGTTYTLARILTSDEAYIGTTGVPLILASKNNPRTSVNGTYYTLYHTGNKPTPADIGASASTHTHNYAGSSSAGGSATTALACTGNSATSTKLQTARTINGVSFDGTANITISASANGGTSTATNYVNVNNTETKNSGRLQFFQKYNDATINPDTGWWSTVRTQHTGYDNGYWQEMAYSFSGDVVKFRRNVNGALSSWRTFAFTDSSITGNSATATTLQTARTLTIGNTGKTFNGSGNVSWSHAELGVGRAYSSAYSFGSAQTAMTTAEFITLISGLGAFSQPYWISRGSWSYASNRYISDTGCGNIHLAGTTVEVMGNSSNYTIRVHTPTTSASGVTNGDFIYVNNGSGYAPGWRRLYNTSYKPTPADIGASPTSHTHDYTTYTATPSTDVTFGECRIYKCMRTVYIYATVTFGSATTLNTNSSYRIFVLPDAIAGGLASTEVNLVGYCGNDIFGVRGGLLGDVYLYIGSKAPTSKTFIIQGVWIG